ncbi:TPM domain-containing protein [Cryobacterium breve]|uniref:TPM domain-containing protein n=1 Tax=Cryobacterium breve TaxID=1259258 RepID=A0ABY7NAP7_9MICO|nr:TPM domain-containing protein [Cryobacterium breve]WBM79576.1 TPM domain-containing protein [Cryobacterium breve]
MRSRRLLFLGFVLAVVGLGAGPGIPVYAEDPPSFGSSHIVDTVGALGSRTGEVTAALDRLYAETRTDLFVAYVDSFSGVADRQQWADQTADENGLGTNDVLLAVATSDRQYQLSVAQNSTLTDAQLLEVETVAIEPALRVNDWAGAAIGAANGFAATIGGQPVPVPSLTPGTANPRGGGSGGGLLTVILVALVAFIAIVVGAIVFFARRGRRTVAAVPGAPTGPAALSTEELSRRAATALVQTDDAVTSSEQELGFALAQYGQEATEAFRTALDSAKAALRAAFTLQQKLDDAVPDTEEQRRDWFLAILDGCEQANTTLDDQAADFAALRQLEKNAPAAAASATSTADAGESRIAAAAARLTELAGRYTPAALGTVADNADQARERIAFARTALSEAGKRIESDPPGAAVGIRAAEESIDQAGLLLDAVDRLGTDLSAAADRISATLAEPAGGSRGGSRTPRRPRRRHRRHRTRRRRGLRPARRRTDQPARACSAGSRRPTRAWMPRCRGCGTLQPRRNAPRPRSTRPCSPHTARSRRRRISSRHAAARSARRRAPGSPRPGGCSPRPTGSAPPTRSPPSPRRSAPAHSPRSRPPWRERMSTVSRALRAAVPAAVPVSESAAGTAAGPAQARSAPFSAAS